MPLRRLSAAFAILVLSAAAATAAPRSIDDCEAIREAMAYNACLASFGPKPGERMRYSAGAKGDESVDMKRSGSARAERPSRGRVKARANGRASMSFDMSHRRPRRR